MRAVAGAVAEQGPGASLTPAALSARAGVPRGEVEGLLADRQAVVAATFDFAVASARERIEGACAGRVRWLDGVKAALVAFLLFLEEEPELGRVCVLYAISATPELAARRAALVGELAAAIDRGRLEAASDRHAPPPVVAEGVVGAVLSLLHNRLLSQERSVMDLYGALVSIVVMPYLGAAVARRELARPAPRLRPWGARGARGAPPVSLSVRLTYRTARVLAAIADYPGASNREVAERAGVLDQGQISKLLTRLEGQGLIVKMEVAPTRGAPNAWRLTSEGAAVLASASARLQAR